MAQGKKTGGRPPGVKNKRTREMAAIIEAAAPGWDPIAWLAMIAQTGCIPPAPGQPPATPGAAPEVEPELRVQCAKIVAPYLYPQKKAVEHSSDPDKPMTFHVTNLDAAI